jgi:hypothetical protein
VLAESFGAVAASSGVRTPNFAQKNNKLHKKKFKLSKKH